MQMRISCLAVFSLLTIGHALILPNNVFSFNSTAPDGALGNLTLGIPEPPRGFDLSYEISGPQLKQTACLMNAIAALETLALGDREAKIIDGTEYHLAEYPEVSFVISTPRRKRNIQAQYVVLAIILGVFELIEEKKFEFTQIELRYYAQVLGWVHIVNHAPSLKLLAGGNRTSGTLSLDKRSVVLPSSNGTMDLEISNITDIITTDDADDLAAVHLIVTFTPFGSTLGIYDVFMPVMSGLSDLAKFSKTATSTGLVVGLESFRGFICILPNGSSPYHTTFHGIPVVDHGDSANSGLHAGVPTIWGGQSQYQG